MATKNSLKNKKILITCGPTWVPIDKIRVISNRSTGELGNTLACQLTKEGAKVTLIQGPTTHLLSCKPNRIIKYHFYDELSKLIKKEAKKKYHVIIHAAAVSDYRLKKIYKTKLNSNLKKLRLSLMPTKKIILKIKNYNPRALLVGFKLEVHLRKQTIIQECNDLFKKARCNLVVANSLSDKDYHGYISDKEKRILAYAKTRKNMVNNLVESIKAHL